MGWEGQDGTGRDRREGLGWDKMAGLVGPQHSKKAEAGNHACPTGPHPKMQAPRPFQEHEPGGDQAPELT